MLPLTSWMFSSVAAGPGPGRYGLPPTIGFVGHDYTKPTSPAYSFHSRMADTSKFFSLSHGDKIQVRVDFFLQWAENNTT